MEPARHMKKDASSEVLRKPRPGGSVWPGQRCPGFAPRTVGLGPAAVDCWSCRYADFHLVERVALDVGVCCWPKVQLDRYARHPPGGI